MRPWAAVVVLVVPATAIAHGAVHERIDALGVELAARPDDIRALTERATLYAEDGDWPAAVGDLDRALALSPGDPDLQHRLANAALHAGDAERALGLSDAVIEREPGHADAHLVRARAFASLGDVGRAAEDFGAAIDLARPPSPRTFVERARLLAGAGPEHADEALRGLEEGARRLGPLVTLVEAAVEIERARGRAADALTWIDRLPPAASGSARWRAQRATILREAGRLDEARAEYERGQAALAELPESRRQSPAMRELADEIDRAMAELSAPRAAEERTTGLPWAAGIAVALALAYGLQRAWRSRSVVSSSSGGSGVTSPRRAASSAGQPGRDRTAESASSEAARPASR